MIAAVVVVVVAVAVVVVVAVVGCWLLLRNYDWLIGWLLLAVVGCCCLLFVVVGCCWLFAGCWRFVA